MVPMNLEMLIEGQPEGKYRLGDVNSFSFGPNNVGVRNFETHIITADHSMDTTMG